MNPLMVCFMYLSKTQAQINHHLITRLDLINSKFSFGFKAYFSIVNVIVFAKYSHLYLKARDQTQLVLAVVLY